MTHVCFITFPGCQMLAYVLGIETLAAANRAGQEELFTWETRVPGHLPVKASNGVEISPDAPNWNAAETVDLAVIIAGPALDERIPNGFRKFVTQVAGHGGSLAGFDTGSLMLARMGLLDGRQAVVHAGPDAAEEPAFPEIRVLDRPFVLDGDRLTSSGGTTPMAAMQAWVAHVSSSALAETAVHALARGHMRDTTPAPDPDAPPADPVVAQMEDLMRANLATPLPLSELAEQLGMSRKALRGRCMRALGVRPSDRYLAIRLAHAADLLRKTAMPMSEISAASGFETPAGFSRSVKQQMGVSPSAVRKLARAARMVSSYA